ncbi:MAG: DUF4337 domain-containing protein [Chloroflexi bacterium]|nr:DUF4337 domain-containing protein [Chloroflexota bacterium]
MAATDLESRLGSLEHGAERQEAEQRAAWWIKWVAATTAVISALAAFGSVRSQGFANEALFHSNQAVLYQAQASDAWNEFQANSLKRHVNENSAAELRTLGAGTGAAVAAEQRATALDQAVAAKYRPSQDALEPRARELEAQRDGERTEADTFRSRKDQTGLAVGVFQGAIGLASVAALTKRFELWLLGVAAGIGGLVYLLLGLF